MKLAKDGENDPGQYPKDSRQLYTSTLESVLRNNTGTTAFPRSEAFFRRS